MHERFVRLAVDGEINEHAFIDAIVVPSVVGRHLIRPFCFPSIRIAGKDRHGPFVFTRTLVGIPRAWVSGAVIEKVEFWVVAVPPPSGAAAFLPFLAFPSRNSQIFSLMRRVGRREIFADQHLSIWPGAVGAPDLFARIDVVSSDKTAHPK